MKKKNILITCLREIRKCEPQSIQMAFFLGVLEALIPLISSLQSSLFVDGLERGLAFGTLAGMAVFGVAVLFAMNALRGKMDRSGLPHTEYCNDLVEWEFYEKSMEMSYAQADSPETAALRARIDNDYDWGCGAYFMVPQFQRCVNGVVGAVCAALLLIPVFLQGGLWRHWSTLLFLLLVLAATFCSIRSEKKTYGEEEKLRQEYDTKSSRSNYLMRGGITYREGKDIRIYQAQPMIKNALREEERDKMVDGESHLERKAGFLDGSLSGLLMGGAYLFIVLRAISGALSAGSIVLFAAAVYRFSESLKTLSKSVSEIRMNARRMESTFEYLDLPDRMESGGVTMRPEDGCGAVEFQDVSYTYPGAASPALSHVSFRLEPGKKIAVVGMNGSGKTTMVKLLCRLYDPDDGRVMLNGRNVREYDYEEYLRRFSVVFQDFQLLALPLGENVAGGKDYDAVRVQDCLEKAGFGRRLQRMKDGLSTFLYRNMDQEGVEISGGEAQKIALARALYKDAPIVVLDEPTAALDPVSEHEVYSGFRNLVGGRTAIFISHRLSSCRFCDEILVFHQGQLVQRGSHEELVKEEEGLYASMWRAQAQYYEQDGAFVKQPCSTDSPSCELLSYMLTLKQ